jgi:hypothetical protein
MNRSALVSLSLLVVAAITVNAGSVGRALKQANRDPAVGTTVTVTADKPNVDAIAITPVLPYPQTGYFCNVTGDSRIPKDFAVFPLTVRVPVGVAAKVIFANITGTIPGTSAGCVSSVVQQPGTTVAVQQPGTSVVQPGTNSTSVVQPGTSSVVQPGTSSVVQPGTTSSSSSTSVVQPGTSQVVQPGTSQVVQPGTSQVVQPGTSQVVQPGTSQVVQPGTSQVVQPGTSQVVQPGTSQVVQPGTSQVVQPGTSQVVQPGTTSVVQPGTNSTSVVQPGTSSVVQPGTASPPLCSSTPTTVVQQPSTVVQQPGTPGVATTSVQQLVNSQGRRLSQATKPAPIEYISNNGSMGQPQLAVLDTVEGVPNIVFTPTAAGQTASFTGALQVAVTTTNDGFGTPFVPYRVDSKLSPNCGVLVRFVAV